MNGKGTVLFDPHTACLTEQAMYDYLDGKLLPSESHAVEKHLLDCAFCSEAMEGLELVKDRSKVMAALPITGTQEDENKKGSGGRIRPFYFNTRFAIAAVMILLIGSFVVLKYMMGDFEKKAMLSENSAAAKTDTTKDGLVTSDDETFYKHFEPFPAAETPEGKPENKTERKETGESNAVFNWTPSNTRQPAQDGDMTSQVLTLPPSPASGAKAAPDEVTLKQNDANIPVLEKKVAPATEPVAAFKQEKEKDESGKSIARSESQVQDKSTERDKGNQTMAANEHAANAPAAKMESKKASKSDKKQVSDDLSKSDNYVYRSAEETKDAPKKDAGPEQHRMLTVEKPEEKNKEAQLARADSITSSIATKTTNANQISTTLGSTSSDYRTTEETTPVSGGQGTGAGMSAGASVAAKVTTSTNGYYNLSGSTVNANISTATTPIDEAMKAYQAKDFQGAVDKFNKILLSDPGNTKALFYAGVSYLSLATPDTKHAIDNFDRVLIAEDASFGEASKWYKALALIKENNIAQAKPLLDEINNGKGVYKAKAASVLRDLNKAKKK